MKEEYRAVKGYEGLYEVSNLGNVKSIGYGKPKVLKPKLNRGGYLHVSLSKNKKPRDFKVHRLVAQAFLDNYSNDLQVDHINTNRVDNHADNLRMCTAKENCNNPITKKHISESSRGRSNPMYGRTGKNNPRSRRVYCIELDKHWDSLKECADELGVHPQHISNVCTGKYKHTGGYHFKYYVA